MMMKIVKQWPWHPLPLPHLPGCLSFDSPNENITAKCLMAKATNKVTPNIKTTIITNPSLVDCIDESEGSNEEVN